jgi:hypothetical protein
MIHQLSIDYPIRLLCDVLECLRRSYYYHAVPAHETALCTAIEQLVIRWPFYGYRRITAQLRREDWRVNSQVVCRMLHYLIATSYGHAVLASDTAGGA